MPKQIGNRNKRSHKPLAYLESELSTHSSVDEPHLGRHDTNLPYRPVQYLGNKLRALPAILEASESLIDADGHIADLFTGSTVVAQGFAARGHRVSAADTQFYAVVFAQAMLGIGRRPGESCSFATLSGLGVVATNDDLRRPWMEFVGREDEAIARADASSLEAVSSTLPLIWRMCDHPLRKHVEAEDRRSAIGELPLLTAVYAGSYFGVRQALLLDELRQNVNAARAAGCLTSWQYSAALTAIMSAASSAVHSAGKHFAQPLNAGSSENQSFLRKRLLQDRRVEIGQEFEAACNAIDAQAVPRDLGHRTWLGPAESFVSSGIPTTLYYLDPPYTAQQYSRFYHVLETICTYQYPQLFEKGKLTTGLYPANRYKSAFSSKRKAPAAFEAIVRAAGASRAALAISYSQSSAASRGNARMITLEQLLDLCSAEFGQKNVEMIQLGHRYRQFNSSAASNSRRDDPEILITCKRR